MQSGGVFLAAAGLLPLLMPTFTPPSGYKDPRFHPDDPGSVKRARRFFKPAPTGLNVWITVDDVVTLNQPADDLVKREFLGARTHTVTTEEAATLTAAGYTVNS